jgi:hypothetical protein
MNVALPWFGGYCLSALFFWCIAVVPTISIAELGERGYLSWVVFHQFSSNTIGIVSATTGIWLLNLIIPSVVGSILLFKMKLLG